jgi:hypothetical protein
MMEGAANPFERALFAIPSLLEDQAYLQHRGRYFDVTVALGADDTVYYLPFSQGELTEIVPGPALMRPSAFALSSTSDAWLEHWRAMPRPGFHDIFAMSKNRILRIEGDFHALMTHLQFVKDVLALPRQLRAAREVESDPALAGSS